MFRNTGNIYHSGMNGEENVRHVTELEITRQPQGVICGAERCLWNPLAAEQVISLANEHRARAWRSWNHRRFKLQVET